MSKVIAVTNQKGGVGKTTTSVNLSAALAYMGKKVLLIDIDPQANATQGLGVDRASLECTIYDAIAQQMPIQDISIPSGVDNLDIVPANIDLAGVEIELSMKEFDLLYLLASNRGIVFSRVNLLESVWGYDYIGETRTVDVHISNLRKKIEEDDAHPVYIKTVRGVGYKFQ